MSIIKLDQNLDPTFSRATTANYKDLSATAAASGVIRYENVVDNIVIDTKREWDRGTHSGTQASSGHILQLTSEVAYVAASGIYTSEWFNLGVTGAVISSASGVTSSSSGTVVSIEYRTSDSDSQATTSSWSASATASAGKYIQFRATLSADGTTSNFPSVTSLTIIPTSLGKAVTIEESTVNLLTSPTAPATQDVTVTANGDYALSFVGTDAASGTVTIEHKLLETTTADFGTGTLVGTTASSNALTLSLEADPTFTRATSATQRDGSTVSSGNARYEDCIKQIQMTTQGDFDACTKTGPIYTSPAGTAAFGAIIDGFDADTSWAYTGTTATGTITPTFNTASSRLELITSTAAAYGTYTYNDFVATDVAIEAVCSQSLGGGMVARYIDANNFYLLFIVDDTSSATNNLQIYKFVAGVITQLGSTVNLTFTRGTQYTFRFEIVGSQLSAYQDGVLKLTVNDTALSAAGKVGLYTNSTATASYFHSFTIDPVTPLFARNSVAYGQDGVSVAAGIPRYTRGKNMLTANQSNAETNTTGISASTNATVTRDTVEFYAGIASFKVVTSNVGADEGAIYTLNDASIINKISQQVHTGSVYLKGSGTVNVWVRFNYKDGTNIDGTPTLVTLSSTWTRYSAVSASPTKEIKDIELHVRTNVQQGITFYMDNAQVELAAAATTWEVGGDNAILVENAATNLLPAGAENINAGQWINAAASFVRTAGQADPFGGTGAVRIQTTGGAAAYKWYISCTVTNGLKYSVSIWVKNNDAVNSITINDNHGHVVSIANADGWKLVRIENTTASSLMQIVFSCVNAGTDLDAAMMWPQIEQNAYCTSYITPNTTRSQEDSKLSMYPFTDPSQGSIFFMAYWDGDLDAATCLGTHNLMCFDGPSSGGNLLRIVRASTYLDFRTANNAGTTTTVSWSNPHTTLAVGWHMFGVRWSSSRVSLYVDGVERAFTTSSINIPSIAPNRYLDIGGAGTTSGSQQWNFPIDGISFFSTSLTDAEMVAYSQIT